LRGTTVWRRSLGARAASRVVQLVSANIAPYQEARVFPLCPGHLGQFARTHKLVGDSVPRSRHPTFHPRDSNTVSQVMSPIRDSSRNAPKDHASGHGRVDFEPLVDADEIAVHRMKREGAVHLRSGVLYRTGAGSPMQNSGSSRRRPRSGARLGNLQNLCRAIGRPIVADRASTIIFASSKTLRCNPTLPERAAKWN
jgi:hypothetical protein